MRIVERTDATTIQSDDLINDLPWICDNIPKKSSVILHTNQEIIPSNPYILIDGEEVYPSALSMFTEVYSQGRKVEI